MKLHVAVLEKDSTYLNRLANAFRVKYPENVEMYLFTDLEHASAFLSANKADVLLIGDEFPDAFKLENKKTATAFLVNSSDIESLNDIPAICKFQKIDLIYKQILGLYAEKTNVVVEKRFSKEEARSRLICFASPAGGTGTSSLAAACSLNYAKKGYKVLYLNLERFGAASEYFAADGSFTMSDVIYATKSDKSNLPIKLESYVRHDPRGISFYYPPKVA